MGSWGDDGGTDKYTLVYFIVPPTRKGRKKKIRAAAHWQAAAGGAAWILCRESSARARMNADDFTIARMLQKAECSLSVALPVDKHGVHCVCVGDVLEAEVALACAPPESAEITFLEAKRQGGDEADARHDDFLAACKRVAKLRGFLVTEGADGGTRAARESVEVIEREWQVSAAEADGAGWRATVRIPFVLQITKEPRGKGSSLLEAEVAIDTMESSLRHNATSVSIGGGFLQDLFTTTFASGAFGIDGARSATAPLHITQPVHLSVEAPIPTDLRRQLLSVSVRNGHPTTALWLEGVNVRVEHSALPYDCAPQGLQWSQVAPLPLPVLLRPGEQYSAVGCVHIDPSFFEGADAVGGACSTPVAVAWADAHRVQSFQTETCALWSLPARTRNDLLVRVEPRGGAAVRVGVANLSDRHRCLELCLTSAPENAGTELEPEAYAASKLIVLREEGQETALGSAVGFIYDDGELPSDGAGVADRVIPLGCLAPHAEATEVVPLASGPED